MSSSKPPAKRFFRGTQKQSNLPTSGKAFAELKKKQEEDLQKICDEFSTQEPARLERYKQMFLKYDVDGACALSLVHIIPLCTMLLASTPSFSDFQPLSQYYSSSTLCLGCRLSCFNPSRIRICLPPSNFFCSQFFVLLLPPLLSGSGDIDLMELKYMMEKMGQPMVRLYTRYLSLLSLLLPIVPPPLVFLC